MKLPILLVVGACGLAAAIACTSAAPAPASAAPGPPAGSDAEAGRALYLEKCGGCHRTYPVSHVAAEKWPALLDRMAEKAKLTSEEEKAVRAYVLSSEPAKR